MATTTFSGPIKAGTISNTTGTTVGTDVKNIGQVLMAQTFSTGTTLAVVLLMQTQPMSLFQLIHKSLT